MAATLYHGVQARTVHGHEPVKADCLQDAHLVGRHELAAKQVQEAPVHRGLVRAPRCGPAAQRTLPDSLQRKRAGMLPATNSSDLQHAEAAHTIQHSVLCSMACRYRCIGASNAWPSKHACAPPGRHDLCPAVLVWGVDEEVVVAPHLVSLAIIELCSAPQ